MDSLDLSDISDYEDYMMTTSDDEDLPGIVEVPYWHLNSGLLEYLFHIPILRLTLCTYKLKVTALFSGDLFNKKILFHLIIIIIIVCCNFALLTLYIPTWSFWSSMLKHKCLLTNMVHGEPGNLHP